uniref:Uncharacterized protein n=1 Tax=Rousettus aegyptiacus TaxID=9407 RepID=A0A7J8F1J6_ROUAE|nr:hypothetical protein HJG63_012429 [Rousettus aegyptiacus]
MGAAGDLTEVVLEKRIHLPQGCVWFFFFFFLTRVIFLSKGYSVPFAITARALVICPPHPRPWTTSQPQGMTWVPGLSVTHDWGDLGSSLDRGQLKSGWKHRFSAAGRKAGGHPGEDGGALCVCTAWTHLRGSAHCRCRPEHARSCLISEAKQYRAWVVLG